MARRSRSPRHGVGKLRLLRRGVPAERRRCPTCGASLAVRPGTEAVLPRTRRWYKLVRALRVLVVVVVILGLGWATLSAALTGPPTYTDPLTTAGWQTVGAGNYTYLSGAISGEDYIRETTPSKIRPEPRSRSRCSTRPTSALRRPRPASRSSW